MIRRAKLKDIDRIMVIIAPIIEEMNSLDNYQWDKNYPKYKDFAEDVADENLFVYEDENKEIVGFICVDLNEPCEYGELKWSSRDKAMVIHRMAVNIDFRGRGIGKKLMEFAEEKALDNEISYLKTDTYSLNDKMNGLFKKMGFKQMGEIFFKGKERTFFCYEKKLQD